MDKNTYESSYPQNERISDANEIDDEATFIFQNKNYDPNRSERICCIELENNEQIFITYKDSSTIEDLITLIVQHRNFKKLKQQRRLILTAKNHPHFYDLGLCFYDDIKPVEENKVSFDVKIDTLHSKGLLKNFRTPFFVLKENRDTYNNFFNENDSCNSYNKNSDKENSSISFKDLLKQIIDSDNNQYALYSIYLSRNLNSSMNMILSHPEIEDYFIRSKKGYNDFSPFFTKNLTREDQNLDWFIYDKESINFLMSMNKEEFEKKNNLKYVNGIVYFEDKCEFNKTVKKGYDMSKVINLGRMSFHKSLQDKDLDKYLISLTMSIKDEKGNISPLVKKFKIDSKTTSLDLIEQMSNKLQMLNKDLYFDPTTKVLKVKGLNDYIFDIDIPIINYSYLNECVKLNKTAEYLIVDNPSIIQEDKGMEYQENANDNYVQPGTSNKSSNKKKQIEVNPFSRITAFQSKEISSNSSGDKNSNKDNHLRSASGMTATRISTLMPQPKGGGKFDLNSIANYNKFVDDKNKDVGNPTKVLKNSISNLWEDELGGGNNKNYKKRITKRIGKYTSSNLSDINNLIEILQNEIINNINDEYQEKMKNEKEGEIIINKLYNDDDPDNENEKNQEKRNEPIKGSLGISRMNKALVNKPCFLCLNSKSKYLEKRKKLYLNKKEEFGEVNPNKFSTNKNIFVSEIDKENEVFNNFYNTKYSRSKSKTINNNTTNTNNANNMDKIDLSLFQEPIPISLITRTFSIVLRSASLCELLNSNIYESKNITVLLFRFQLYASEQPYSQPKQIRWTTYSSDLNPIFNKRIYFDLPYNKLLSYCSLLIKVKFIEYNKNKQVSKNETKYWSNFRLFDQNNKLKSGLHKVNLHSREFNDDVYFSYTDNMDDKKSSKIYFEIESFKNSVINDLDSNNNDDNSKKETNEIDEILSKDTNSIDNSRPTNASFNMKNQLVDINESIRNCSIKRSMYHKEINKIDINADDLKKILKIDSKSPFDTLNKKEKEVLWRNRYGVSKFQSLIPKLFLSCDQTDSRTSPELQKIFKMTKNMSVVQAIELLSGKYMNEEIRNYAVKILRNASYIDIQNYLLQLVQALKYEKKHDNPLSRFLIEESVLNPMTVGHEFFWHLRSEMFNQNVQQRFGLYLEIFLTKISGALYEIFKDEDELLKSLIKVANKAKENVTKEERNKNFAEDLKNLNDYLSLNKKEISLPLNFKLRIKGIIVDKCKIMKSKKKPLWLTFENSDPYGDNIVVMFKCGDDLRMDMVTLQLFKSMQTLWFENGLKVKMSLYKVLCTGNMQGMLEMVTNSETLANIHVKEGGAISQFFSKSALKHWIEENCKAVGDDEAKENFLLSNVAYCIATFVLGIGDRHNDNIMMKKNGELFHIDFGHFLGHFKSKLGIKRERAPFVFTRQFQSVLGDDNSKEFLRFKDSLIKAYKLIRNNKDVVITLLRILLCTGIPELNEKSLRFLEGSMAIKMDEKEAIKFLLIKLEESMNSVSTKLNFAIHIVANK